MILAQFGIAWDMINDQLDGIETKDTADIVLGKETRPLSSYVQTYRYEDIITNLERVSDHCSNIAVCMIQVSSGGFDTHAYVNVDIKQSKWFYDEVKRYSEIYTLEEKTDINMDSDNRK